MSANHASLRRLFPAANLGLAVFLALLVPRQGAASSYYVNDASRTNDLYCTASGDDAQDGLGPDTPVASLANLLTRYTLLPSDTVFIDAGTYVLASNIIIGVQHSGSWDNRVTLQGAGRATVMDRQSHVKGDCCLVTRANHMRIRDLTFTGADVGLYVDSSFCSNAEILGNTFFGNSGPAVVVQPTTNTFYGSFMIARNILFDNGGGMVLEPETVTLGDAFKVINNTVIVTNGAALLLGGNFPNHEVRNNILVAKNGAFCLETVSEGGMFQSDYNDLWTSDGGCVARAAIYGGAMTLGTLADWQRFTELNFYGARDFHSFSRDPAFAAPANGDVHLKSKGGRWVPSSGFWVTDSDAHSLCIDAGDPYFYVDDLSSEPAPNGGRKNIGTYGGTSEASMSAPGKQLLALAPDLGQSPTETQPLCWTASGLGWLAGDTVRLDYSLDGGSGWQLIGHATYDLAGSIYSWSRPPESFGSPNGCWVRVSLSNDATISSAVLLPFQNAATQSSNTVFYVNDGERAGDLWCTATGYYGHDGLSSNTPVDSIQTILDRYQPSAGATIYVDAGTYMLYSDLLLPNTGAGNPSNGWFRLIGAQRRSVLNRMYAYTDSACVRVKQDFAQIEGFVCRGAESGIIIDPSTCRNANIRHNTLTANSGYGIRVLPDPNNNGFDTYTIANNLLYGNGGGLNLQSASGNHLANFYIENNTIVVYNGTGIACGGRANGTVLANNIITAKGSGYCLSIDRPYVLGTSDYNNLFPVNGALLARWATNNVTWTASALADWQSKSGFDGAGMSRDPLFVAPTTGDYHLRSTGGSWHGGAWTPDTVNSPCIDAGNPSSAFGGEPLPNGGRINLGAFGGTTEASRSASARLLTLLAPSGGETWSGTLNITWSAAGGGWQGGDSVRIEYSVSGASWTVLPGAASLSPSGAFNWVLPNPTSSTASYYLRVVCNQDASVFDATSRAGTVVRLAATYYVNDASTTGDKYCSGTGISSNSGSAPDKPLPSLEEVLRKFTLSPGDTVYVDTGVYQVYSNIVVEAAHRGSPDAPVRIVGTRGGSLLVRQPGGTNRVCLDVHGDHFRIEGLTCDGADVGLSVNASSARHAQLVANVCRNNTMSGISVKPYGAQSGEEYHLLQNVVVQNGAGLSLQGATNTFDSRCLFILENNTVVNGGTGIKLLNANTVGKRTNFLKNNLIEATNAQAVCILARPNSIHYSDFNNIRPRTGGTVGAWLTATATQINHTSLADWRTASGQDVNSLSLDSQFVSPAAGNYRLKIDSPCVDTGIISFWMFDTSDADGKPRVSGKTADRGAYELYVRTSVRLLLQGPFLGGNANMSSALSQQGLMPLKSPYAEDPRTVSRIPSNTTDWVLLQFRAATNGPALFSRSVFLRKDGWIVNDAGLPLLDADLPPDGAFHVAVKHRNHLAALTASPVAFTNQVLTVDFTGSPETCIGGTSVCVPVTGTNGVCWALRAGDTDGDGAVLDIDRAIWASQTDTTLGYRRTDMNLDGAVTSDDEEKIGVNIPTVSPVPRPETVLQPLLLLTPHRSTLSAGESVTLAGPAGDASTADGSTGGIGTLSAPASSPLSWDFVRNASGGTLSSNGASEALYTAGSVTGSTDIVEAWDSDESLGRAFVNVVGPQTAALAGKALIIAGRTSSGDTLWPTTDYLADNAYATLRYRGFSKENLHYLSPEPSQDVDGNGLLDDIDGESTLAQAAHAFTNQVAGTDRLFVYLVDHGGNLSGNGYFRLSGSETITAAQLDAWLDTLQDASGTHVTVLLDFCYAGSFLDALTYTGTATRIVMAACGASQPSYFVAGGLVSFSGAFFSGVMLGYDIQRCFEMAESAMSTYQAASLDDYQDGLQASGAYIGPTYVAAGDAPQIGEVCGNQVLTEETAATLWIGSLSSLYPISSAWCLIVPPGHDPDPDNPVTGLPQLDLAYDETTGRYTATYDGFTAPGTYNVTFYVQDEQGNVSAPRTSYIAQIGYDDRVILVAGGDTNGASWAAIERLTESVYDTLRLRLFTPDHIRVLSPNGSQDLDGDGTNDVAAAATLDTLHDAISGWALSNSTDRLTLYLLGEGDGGGFLLDGAERLTTNAFAQWVHDFQMTNPVPVNIILDFSGAGAFIPSLADPSLEEAFPEATRVAIASSRAGREALFANGGTVSFSQYLLSGIISGETLGDAYTAARRAIRRVSGDTRQSPQLDDNLNGEPGEKNTDGLLADTVFLGSAFVTGADAPVIGSVIPPTVLYTAGSPVTLWASGVSGMYPISNVWCAVTPPGFSDPENLPTLKLEWNAAASRYETTSAEFALPGAYGLTFYAQDTAGQLSEPMQSEILLTDAYEPDDTIRDASLYDGTPQLHTFALATDIDWVRVYLVSNFIYDIETYHLSDRLDTVIDLYREEADGTVTLLDHIDEEGDDEGEYTGLDYPATGWYWARLSPYSEGTNSLGSYEFSISIPAAAGVNNLIVLGIDDVYASALPSNSTVMVQGLATKTFNGATSVVYAGLTNGTYLVTVPVPANFIAREDPNTPNQVQSLTNLFYANPRRVVVEGGWKLAGFEMLSTVAVTSGVVRDAWTHAYLPGAQFAFTASSGSLTGTVADGSVILTSYRTNWFSSATGHVPPTISLGACNWDLAVSLSGYQSFLQPGAVSNVTAGAKRSLGTVYLVPADDNANNVADAWESLYFPGGMNPDEDADGDGLDNADEYLCGTDPTNALSVLRVLDVSPVGPGAALTWSTAAGRSYQVLSVTSLVSVAAISTNGPWEAAAGQTTMQWTDNTPQPQKARFYRVILDTP